jgi:hypothetical protein
MRWTGVFWRWRLAAVLFAAAGVGCDYLDTDPDPEVEPDALSCFAGGVPDGAEVAGEVEVGFGQTSFASIEPDQELTLYAGIQGGYHFFAHSRIQGLEPGDPQVTTNPGNPHTLFTAYDEDGERVDIHTCGTRIGYIGDTDQADLRSGRLLMIRRQIAEELYGNRVRLVVEVFDSEGRYATHEAWVTAARED